MKPQVYLPHCCFSSLLLHLFLLPSSHPPPPSPSSPPTSTYTHPPPPLLLPLLLIPILTLLPLLPRRCVVCELITVAMAALQGMSLSSTVRSLLITIIWRYVFIGATCMCSLVLYISWVYTGGGGGVIGFEQPPVLSPKQDRLHH